MHVSSAVISIFTLRCSPLSDAVFLRKQPQERPEATASKLAARTAENSQLRCLYVLGLPVALPKEAREAQGPASNVIGC